MAIFSRKLAKPDLGEDGVGAVGMAFAGRAVPKGEIAVIDGA
jgi:hypothetical protein